MADRTLSIGNSMADYTLSTAERVEQLEKDVKVLSEGLRAALERVQQLRDANAEMLVVMSQVLVKRQGAVMMSQELVRKSDG